MHRPNWDEGKPRGLVRSIRDDAADTDAADTKVQTQGSEGMPEFKGTDNFYLILAFIVPGLIIFYVRSKFISGRSPSHTENLISYLVLSLVYYIPTIFFVEKALSVQEPWLARAAIWIALTLVGPALFGFLLGAADQKEWWNLVANKFNLSIVHVIPAAWDWRFSKVPRDGIFIMVTLTSDERVAGFFGRNSFASSDVGERDLYIEEEYIVTEEGQWASRPTKVGILIPVKEIKYIEFWEPQAEERANG